MLPRRARSLVTALIAHGREAGTPAAAAARGAVSPFLSELGYTVQEQPFSFNGGIYRVMPVSGRAPRVVSLVEIPLLIRARAGMGCGRQPCWYSPLPRSLMTFRFLAGDGAPRSARTDANLIAQRQGAVVRCWLVAHLDTKAQGIRWRVGSSPCGSPSRRSPACSSWPACGWALRNRPPRGWQPGRAGVLAGLLLTGGRLTGQSPGARDNGSGLLAVLTAAELTTDPGIGIIITGAEEFGLAGARALARERSALFGQAEVLNVDTIDEEGTLFVVTHGRADVLARRVRQHLAGLAPIRGRRLPLGIMVDGVPLAEVAAGAVTIGRLSWGTLRRMHTPRDDAAGYSLATAELLGERLAAPI